MLDEAKHQAAYDTCKGFWIHVRTQYGSQQSRKFGREDLEAAMEEIRDFNSGGSFYLWDETFNRTMIFGHHQVISISVIYEQ